MAPALFSLPLPKVAIGASTFGNSPRSINRVRVTSDRILSGALMPKINRNGVNIHYEVHGSGPALLLTHGYSSTSAMWQGQIEALSKHHKLVLWDMRGHGQSDDPAAYSEALTVGDMAALLDQVGAASAI